MPVVFVGIAGAGPGLAIVMNNITDRVMYTVGEMVITRNPSLPPPERLLHRRHVGRDMVDTVDHNVIRRHPSERGYDGVQQGLHELVNRNQHCGGCGTGRRCRWAGDGVSVVGVLK